MSGEERIATIRDAVRGDLDCLARLWFSGWQDGHRDILPERLARLRTLETFRERLDEGLAAVRVADRGGALVGFSMLKGDELYQFYVSAEARGTGVASELMDDALARLRSGGVETAWLACAIGNARAARFYEKTGWRLIGTMTSRLETPEGVFPLEVWRYEIELGR